MYFNKNWEGLKAYRFLQEVKIMWSDRKELVISNFKISLYISEYNIL
jgi:hypothetical protein